MNRKAFRLFGLAALLVGRPLPDVWSAESLPDEKYTVRRIEPPVDPLPAEAASAGETKFSFIVYGDTRGRRDGKEVQYEHSLVIDSMLETIKSLKTNGFPAKFVMQAGDAVVNGRDPKQWNVSYVALANRITREAGLPYYLAPGNHDVTAAESISKPERKEGLSNYLAAVNNLIPRDGTLRRLAGYPTYAFGYGNTFVIAMDSNIAADKIQLAWVTAQLRGLDRSRYHHVFAVFHHPPFSSGGHGGAVVEPPARELRNRYMPLFREYRVEGVFTGHEHLFEHWVERYVGKDGRTNRMDLVVTGGGGAPLYYYHGEPDLRDYLKTNKNEKVELEHLVKPGPTPGDNPYHYVVVKIDGEAVRMEVVGVDWGKNFQPYRSRTVDFR